MRNERNANMDAALNKLSESWNDITELVCYGFGRRAARLLPRISLDFRISMLVDNNPQIVGQSFCGVPVQLFAEVKEQLIGRKTIITTGGGAYFSIKKSLEEIGLIEYQDFCRYEDFLVEWYWKNKKQVVLSEVFMCITSRCTFKCRHCNQLMPYYTEETHYEYSVEEIMETMDAFFSKVDILASFFIIGGEPLLHKNLPEIISAMSEKYGDRIGYIQIITNGSIVPPSKLIDAIKKYHIDIRLSDYTSEIPYEKKYQEVQKTLGDNGIVYSTSKYERWFDVGIPGKEKTEYHTPEEIRQHMVDCGPCHVIAEKKFYYCGTFFNSEKCGFTKLRKCDFYDLADPNEKKEKLLAYSIGDIGDDYIETCGMCFGKSEKNERVVLPAVQMKD